MLKSRSLIVKGCALPSPKRLIPLRQWLKLWAQATQASVRMGYAQAGLKLSHPSVRPGFRNFCPLAQLRHSLLRGEGRGVGDGVLSDMAVLGDRTEYRSGLDIIRVIRFFSFGPIRVARFSLDNYEKKVIIFFGLVY